MNLVEIEESFNKLFPVEELKRITLESIKKQIDDFENNYLKEFSDRLEDGLSVKDLIIEYSCCRLVVNDIERSKPYFFVTYNLLNPKTGFTEYYYEIEFDYEGKVCDDYFCTSYPSLWPDDIEVHKVKRKLKDNAQDT